MSNVLIINGALPWSFAPGRLNGSFVEIAREDLTASGHTVEVTTVAEGWDTEAEVDRHLWADLIIYQFPVNSMSVPWKMKQYLDEIGVAGLDGRLADSDGRSAAAPGQNYGMGGKMHGTAYMLSATFNAPEEAFGNVSEAFFAGASVDDLLRPLHLNARFFGMRPRATFAAFDVMKNPDIEADFDRFRVHLRDAVEPQKAAA